MVEITDVLHPGVVYLGKYIKGSQKAVPDLDVDKLVLKVIYSGVAFEPYGKKVHKYLESKDMAPKYFFSFDMNGGGLPSNADIIEDHHLMEYLPPPSNNAPGWISLLDLEVRFPQVASCCKVDIQAALYNIIDVVGDAKFVHGNLWPNCQGTPFSPNPWLWHTLHSLASQITLTLSLSHSVTFHQELHVFHCFIFHCSIFHCS